MLRLGIIGAGSVMKNAHAPAIAARDDVVVSGVADAVESAARDLAAALGCDKITSDYRVLLADPDVDAVDICLPHFLHYEAVMAAFEAGKDVLLEKPIALTLDEADAMIAASKDTGCRFYVNLNQRFFPAHRALKRAVTDGTYGAPFLALAHLIGDEYAGMCNPEHWKGTWDKAGGGTLIDTGTHIVDLMLWWFGAPRRVSCQWGRLQVGARNKADDNVVVTLGYDHMLADIVVSYTVRTDLWREDKAVYFPEASLHLKMESETPLCIGRERQPPAPVSGVEAMPNWWPGTERASVNHFLDCLQGKAEPEFGPEAGREALALILTAYQAARENRTLCFDPRD